MEKTLRIREVSHNHTPAVYTNIDLGHGSQAFRGKTVPDMVDDSNYEAIVTITFIPDTPHNRAYFLQQTTCEVAVHNNGQWEKVSPSWLKAAFAPAVDVDDGLKAPPEDDEPEVTEKATISGLSDFEKIHKTQQSRALKSLVASSAPKEFKVGLLNDIIKSNSKMLAGTVRDAATVHLKNMAAE